MALNHNPENPQKLLAVMWSAMTEATPRLNTTSLDALIASEVMSSILRRQAKDLGATDGMIETLRVLAGSIALGIYQDSGAQQQMQEIRGAMKRDDQYTEQQRSDADKVASAAIQDAMRKAKDS